MSNLQLRVLFGVLGGAAVVGSLSWGVYGCLALFLIISSFARFEFYGLLKKAGRDPDILLGTILGTGLHLLSFAIEEDWLKPTALFLFFPGIAIVFIARLFRRTPPDPFGNTGLTLLGIIYTDLPFCLLYFGTTSPGTYDSRIILGSLFLLWASDTGAYFMGSNFGRTPLFPSVSPKKSWEGAAGALLSALMVASVLARFWPVMPDIHWAVLSVIIVVIGSYGDLSESQFKRSLQIKDSGGGIPGHGGFLDRFDGLLPAAPFIVAYLKLVVFP
ncbi:MAG: phosphatidate cytidylyltransferase [Bacteroidota bacterium]